MKKLRRKEGITLIALVVTIVVLIILAGISIHLVLGDNGIVEKTKLGKENMEKAQQEEKDDLLEVSNEMDFYIASSSREPRKATVLYEGELTGGDVTFLNGHSVDEFDAIRFIYGMKREESSWDNLAEVEYSKTCWNFAMEHASTNPWTISMCGFNDREISLDNLSKTGFSIGTRREYSIAMIYGVNY